MHFSTTDHWQCLDVWLEIFRETFFFLYLHFKVCNCCIFFVFVTLFFLFLILISFTSWLIFRAYIFLFNNISSVYSSWEIRVFTYCLSTVFKLLVAAGRLHKEEQSIVGLKESLKKTKWRNGKLQENFLKELFSRELLSKTKLDHANKLQNCTLALWYWRSCSIIGKKGFYLNLKSWRAGVLWMYLRI